MTNGFYHRPDISVRIAQGVENAGGRLHEKTQRVGEVDLFRHPTAGWLEGFTLRQAEDYEITEV